MKTYCKKARTYKSCATSSDNPEYIIRNDFILLHKDAKHFFFSKDRHNYLLPHRKAMKTINVERKLGLSKESPFYNEYTKLNYKTHQLSSHEIKNSFGKEVTRKREKIFTKFLNKSAPKEKKVLHSFLNKWNLSKIKANTYSKNPLYKEKLEAFVKLISNSRNKRYFMTSNGNEWVRSINFT